MSKAGDAKENVFVNKPSRRLLMYQNGGFV